MEIDNMETIEIKLARLDENYKNLTERLREHKLEVAAKHDDLSKEVAAIRTDLSGLKVQVATWVGAITLVSHIVAYIILHFVSK
jgi:predicted  nucleic acid-binding Zn-ribbon protein